MTEILGVGFAVLGFAVTGFIVLRKRQSASVPASPPAVPASPAIAERRSSARRTVTPVIVKLRSYAVSEEFIEGLVVEVSQGGLGLSLKKPVEVGREVDVRVTTSPAAPWVPVEVRHCSSAGLRWNVGCKFTGELEPAVRGLFG